MSRPAPDDKRIRSYTKMDGKHEYHVIFERPDGSRYTLTVTGSDPNRKGRVTLKGGPCDGERVKATRPQRLGDYSYYKNLGNGKEAVYTTPCEYHNKPAMGLIYLWTQAKSQFD